MFSEIHNLRLSIFSVSLQIVQKYVFEPLN
jgi:hypothetical protein